MKVFVLSGSHRKEAQTLKVARYIESAIPEEIPGAKVHLFSLSENPVPLWDEEFGGAPDEIWDPISKELKEADALVVATPEWSGMATPGVKNFLLNCTVDEIGYKPGFIVTVSASRGGSYPISELRMSGTKNNRLTWIPDHAIVQHAEANLNSPENAPDLSKEDKLIRGRIRYGLRLLHEYAKALRGVRASGVIDVKNFKNGM